MCEAGRVLHHLKHNIEDPRSTILIAGYQAPDTLGRRLVERRPEVRILGRAFALKAEVVVLNGLSSHADHGGLLRAWARWPATARKRAAGPRRAGAGGGAGGGLAGGWVRRCRDSGTRRERDDLIPQRRFIARTRTYFGCSPVSFFTTWLAKLSTICC